MIPIALSVLNVNKKKRLEYFPNAFLCVFSIFYPSATAEVCLTLLPG